MIERVLNTCAELIAGCAAGGDTAARRDRMLRLIAEATGHQCGLWLDHVPARHTARIAAYVGPAALDGVETEVPVQAGSLWRRFGVDQLPSEEAVRIAGLFPDPAIGPGADGFVLGFSADGFGAGWAVVWNRNRPGGPRDAERICRAVHRLLSAALGQAEPRDATALLEKAFESLRDVVLVLDVPKRAIVMCNSAVKEVFGYEPEEVIGRTTEFLHVDSEHFKEFARLGDETLERTGVFRCEFQMRRKDGAVIDTDHQVTAIKGESRAITRVVSVVRDITARTHAEQALAREKDFTDQLIASLPGIFYVLSAGGRPLRWNKNAERITGYTRAEIAGMRAIQFFAEEDQAAVLNAIRQVFEQGEAETEAHVRTRGGELIPFYLTGRRVEVDGVVHLVGTGLDMSGHKANEEALRELAWEVQERVKESQCLYLVANLLFQAEADTLDDTLQTVAEQIPKAWQFPDWAGARLVVRRREYRSAHYAPSDLRQAVTIQDAGRELGTIEVCYPECVGDETDNVFLDEERMLLEALAHHIAESLRRLDAEDALTRSEAHFRSLIEQAADQISVLGSDGTMLYLSPSTTRLLGYDLDELLGRNVFDYIHPDDRDRIREIYHAARGVSWEGGREEYRIRHKDGSWRVMETVGTNQLDNPVISGIVVNSRDITERKELEEQFLEMQRLDAVGRLAGGVAHDFNNILTVIDGYSEFIESETEPDDPRFEDIQQIRKAARRAANLTSQLLSFSRRQMLVPRDFSVNELLGTKHEMFQRLIGEDIELRFDLEDDAPHIHADPDQMEQALLNLLVNAREAMPQGGSLTVITATETWDETDEARPDDCPPGQYVSLTVKDDGTGMPPEILAQVFEPFFSTKEMGTGLGLSTVYGLVKQSRGHVEVDSEVGKGTTVRVYLPAAAEHGAFAPESTTTPQESRGRETILLVEDAETVRQLAKRILTHRGYSVIDAMSGPDALRAAADYRERIDLLVTDVVMPHMSGKELADALIPRRPGMRVLFMSGYTKDALGQHGLSDGDYALLLKPFTADDLASRVRQVLDG